MDKICPKKTKHMCNLDSEGDNVVFLSPPESVEGEAPDQGASPTLRRSNRKRKFLSNHCGMSKNSGKKKKTRPEQQRSMLRIPRTHRPKVRPRDRQEARKRTAPRRTREVPPQTRHRTKPKALKPYSLSWREG